MFILSPTLTPAASGNVPTIHPGAQAINLGHPFSSLPHTPHPIHQQGPPTSLRSDHFPIQVPCSFSKFPNGRTPVSTLPSYRLFNSPAQNFQGFPHAVSYPWGSHHLALSPTSFLTAFLLLAVLQPTDFLPVPHTSQTHLGTFACAIPSLRMHFLPIVSCLLPPALIPSRSKKGPWAPSTPTHLSLILYPALLYFYGTQHFLKLHYLSVYLFIAYLPHKLIRPMRAVNICPPHDLNRVWTE